MCTPIDTSHTSKQLCYFFYANIILNMLSLTFLFETCDKTEIQYNNAYYYVKIKNSRGLWHRFEVRPSCTSVLSDQALFCWLVKFIF